MQEPITFTGVYHHALIDNNQRASSIATEAVLGILYFTFACCLILAANLIDR